MWATVEMREAIAEEPKKEYVEMKAVPDRLVKMNRKLMEIMSLVRFRFASSSLCFLLILFFGSPILIDNPVFFVVVVVEYFFQIKIKKIKLKEMKK